MNEATFVENPSGKLVTKSKVDVKKSIHHSFTALTNMSAELSHENQKQKIGLISYVEKRPDLGLHKASSEIKHHWSKEYGRKFVAKDIEKGKINEDLFQDEISHMLALNKKGNPYVPRVIESRHSYLKMQFISGIEGDKILESAPNFETKLLITQKTLDAIKSVFQDGVINMEYAPKNTIIVPNQKTGLPEKITLIDFGISFQIGKDGKIEVDMDKLNKIDYVNNRNSDQKGGIPFRGYRNQAGLLPPELTSQTGKVKVDAEKCLVWSLTHRVIGNWLIKEKIPGIRDFVNRAISPNPAERPTLDELISFVRNITLDESKIGSILSDDQLKANNDMLGTPSKEIAVSEESVRKILEELAEMKKTKE